MDIQFISARRYYGGCQCGSVVYEARLDASSTCPYAPSVWERLVQPGTFKLVRGEELLRGYQFGEEGVHHFYCERCGARAYTHYDVAHCGELQSVDLKSLLGAGELGLSAQPGTT